MPSVLFAHTNFPAQFGAFGHWLAERGWDVGYVTARGGVRSPPLRVRSDQPKRKPAEQTHAYAVPLEEAILNGQALARAALSLAQEGFQPDLVVAHAGWGAGHCLPELFPQAAFVSFVEWWYNTPAPDVAFLEPMLGTPAIDHERVLRQAARNVPIAFDMARADAVWCPTGFQASQFPATWQGRIRVEHDGIDLDVHAPVAHHPDPTLGGSVPADAPVFTYATRGQEPHRGFPQAIGAIAHALRALPNAHAVVVGENRVAYGGAKIGATDWRAHALAEHAPDPSRVHFVDALPRPRYLEVLQRSNGHLYLTAPFVLSWSMLESMAVGVPLVASDTAPVREYATDGHNALLRSFYDTAALGDALVAGWHDRAGAAARGAAARETIHARADAARLWPARAAWMGDLIRAKAARR